MQLRVDGLAAHLQRGPLGSLYTIASAEPLLQIEAADAIRQAARQAGYTERTVVTVGPRFAWSELQVASASLSLFAERRIVELRIPSGKPGKDGAQALQTLAATAAQDADTLTLITLPRADGDMRKSAWFSALTDTGIVLVIDAIERAQLPDWIARRLGAQGQSAPTAALSFIADRVEGNLLAAHQEVRKLGLLYDARALTLDEVSDAVLNVARYDVFKLSEALLAGDAPRFCRMMAGLKGEGEAIQLVLWAFAEELRTLWRVQQAQRAGQSVNAAMKELRVWGPRTQWLPQAVTRISPAVLARAIRRCAALDKAAKGLVYAAAQENLTTDVWEDLLAVGLSLMGSAQVRRRAAANQG